MVKHNDLINSITVDCLFSFTDEAGASGMDWEQEESATKLTSKKEYDCVICNQTTPSSEDKPMGLVVLVQVMHFLIH